MKIRIRLDEIMRERCLTARQVAEMTSITETAISEWRTNKVERISLTTLKTLCDALKVTPGDLLVNDRA